VVIRAFIGSNRSQAEGSVLIEAEVYIRESRCEVRVGVNWSSQFTGISIQN
jgi:hypothetical protein